MRKVTKYHIDHPEHFKNQIIQWADDNYPVYMVYGGAGHGLIRDNAHSWTGFDFAAAVGVHNEPITMVNDSFAHLQHEARRINDWLYGFITYDSKNEIENLTSANYDGIEMPGIYFFQPTYLFRIIGNELSVEYLPDCFTEKKIDELYEYIARYNPRLNDFHEYPEIKARMSRERYIQNVLKIKEHIMRGDVYELNFCMEFFTENVNINPVKTCMDLWEVSPTPFSALVRVNDKYLMSASPERFLKKTGNKIISQPIKGTMPRGLNADFDIKNISLLREDKKERAENIMTVDLVRNDLSKVAAKGSVKVEELCEVYSFRQVHQMISTISAVLGDDFSFADALKHTFPMGSMTGSPKIMAMKLIEKYEKTKRGLYSGAVGFITPEQDFDFNVVIRSILYNASRGYLSFSVGSAITAQSDPIAEYNECLVKASAIFNVLNPQFQYNHAG